MTEDSIITPDDLVVLPDTIIVLPAIEYRLYYDSNGRVITYTCERLAGDYIVITREQYAEARSDVTVVNGAIKPNRNNSVTFKLEKNISRGIKTSKYDISVLVTDEDTEFNYWEQISYD